MSIKKWIVSFAVFLLCVNEHSSKVVPVPCFSEDFVFGVSTASYQVEGAWNISGKGENIWDHYTHAHPERVFDHHNGDVACDSYHQFKEDVKMLKQLKVQFYRFSISWARILPDGNSNKINPDGLRYYHALIDELLANNIVPLVTMYHWDLPQSLQQLGGWTNPLMVDYFADYAKVLFEEFGSKVNHWITFNEPLSFCEQGYGGNDAPGYEDSGVEDYMCGHNTLRAHAKVYRMYDRHYRNKFGRGAICITLDMPWIEPVTQSQEDQTAAETARQFMFGWFAHPIFSPEGDYPPIMRSRIDENSRRQNFPRSRLPKFTADEIEALKGSSDFLCLNHYTTVLASPNKVVQYPKPSFFDDMGVKFSVRDDWPRTNSTWLRVVPWGLRKNLNWIKKTYNNPLVLITENGISLEPGLNDSKRIEYVSGYLRALHDAVYKDGCKVKGYTYWSLMDNFEWMRGFSERFGLYEVDYTSSRRARTARSSARYFADIASTRCVHDPRHWYHHQNREGEEASYITVLRV